MHVLNLVIMRLLNKTINSSFKAQYRSDARYKACVGGKRLDTEANTCLYMVKWVYTRRQAHLHEKANSFALYLASDLYSMWRPIHIHVYTCTCM